MDVRNDNTPILPKEAWQGEIGDKHPSAIINLSQSYQCFHTLFSSTGELQLASRCLRQLLNHAALGEWEDAECMWKLFPDLLTCRGTVFFPNRTIDNIDIPKDQHPGRYKYVGFTPLKIAMANEEWEVVEEMAKYIDKEEIQKQFAELFPDGEIKCHRFDLEKAKELLRDLFDAVTNDDTINEKNLEQMNQTTREKWNAFFEYVNPTSEHKTGLVCDARIYVEALKLYDENFSQFKNWDQRSFWCIRSEEYSASLLGTGHLRPHSQGIMNQGTLKGCELSDGSSVHPFRRVSQSIPGVHFFVGIFGGAARVRGRRARFKACVKQKREQGQSLRSNISTPTHRLA